MSVTRADLYCVECGRPSIGPRCIRCINGFFKRPEASRVDVLLTWGFVLITLEVLGFWVTGVFLFKV